MSRLLVVTPEPPDPTRSAGDARLCALLSGLAARGNRVTLVSERPGESRNGTDASFPWERSSASVRELLSRCAFDAVIAEFWTTAAGIAKGVRRYRPNAALLIDTVDLHFARRESAARVGLDAAGNRESEKDAELAAYRLADALIVCSEEERALLAARPEMPPVSLVPIPAEPRPRASKPRGPDALFVGGFRHAPNADGLMWLLAEIWPAVRAAVPEATLTVVGADADDALAARCAATPGVDFQGWQPDLEPFYDRARLAVAPLRFGAGMKGKVAEALARGLPVVTTSIGAQGFSGGGMIVEEAPGRFAEAMVGLLREPTRADALGALGRESVRETCDPALLAATLERAIESAIESRRVSAAAALGGAAWRGAARLARVRP